ncbi:MAG: hypothetical protein WEC75_14990 [Dehalococcoidia bacterium]
MNENLKSTNVGKLLGMNVMLVGRDDTGERTYQLPNGLQVTTSNALPILRAWVRAYDAERTVDLVSAISSSRVSRYDDLNHELNALGADAEALTRDYQLAFIVRELLGDEGRGSNSGLICSPTDLVNLSLMVINSRCPADEQDSGWAFVQRFAYQQFWDQENYSAFSRGVLLQREMHAHLSPADRFDLNGEFRALFGLDLDTFLFLSFGLYAMGTAQPGRTFDESQFVQSPHFNIARGDAEAFFGLISRTFDEYRDACHHPATVMDGFDLYNLNPLLRWPALRRPSGRFVVPIPRYLLDRASIGIYLDFLQGLSDERAGAFGNFWGNAFGAYAGELLRRTPNCGTVVPGDENEPRGGCDWIVDDNQTLLLIECKTAGLSARARITGEEEYLRNDVARLRKGGDTGSSIAGGVVQLMRTHDRLRSQGDQRPKICLLVTLDKLHFGNNREWLHRFIREEAEKLYGGPLPTDFQVSDVGGLERLCALSIASGQSPASLLTRKMGSEETLQLDLMLFDVPGVGVSAHPLLDEVGAPSLEAVIATFRVDGDDEVG